MTFRRWWEEKIMNIQLSSLRDWMFIILGQAILILALIGGLIKRVLWKEKP